MTNTLCLLLVAVGQAPSGFAVRTLAGGLTASVALDPGANVVAEFDGLGSVEVHS